MEMFHRILLKSMDFDQVEKSGVRLSWKKWPLTRKSAKRMLIPLSIQYTPFSIQFENSPTIPAKSLEYIQCSCGAFANQMSVHDHHQWRCNFCSEELSKPAGEIEGHVFQHLTKSWMTEFIVDSEQAVDKAGPVFVLVVDRNVTDAAEDLALKNLVLKSISTLPNDAQVALISFGERVHIHDMYQPTETRLLANQAMKPSESLVRKLNACKPILEHSIYHLLKSDPIAKRNRPMRCTGTALLHAIQLAGRHPGGAGRVMVFTGGPCTLGSGKVVDCDMVAHRMRSHYDISNDNDKARYTGSAKSFYKSLSDEASKKGCAIDIISCCLDQTGLFEMQCCADDTGGNLIMDLSFASDSVGEMVGRVLEKGADGQSLLAASNISVRVRTCGNFKVGCRLEKLDDGGGEKKGVVRSVGPGTWRDGRLNICAAHKDCTVAILFRMAKNYSEWPQDALVQLIVDYEIAGVRRIRVVTVALGRDDFHGPEVSFVERHVNDDGDDEQPDLKQGLAQSFDQEASAVLIAKLAAVMADGGDDPRHWINSLLFKSSLNFIMEPMIRHDATSVKIDQVFSLLPEFMLHLVRSPLIAHCNTSPDQSAFYRHRLYRESCTQAAVMMRPHLFTYDLDGREVRAPLNAASLNDDGILFMDSYFQLVVYRGKYAAKDGLPPSLLARRSGIEGGRFLVPGYVEAEQGKSGSRLLLARLDRVKGHVMSELILSHAITLPAYVEHLFMRIVGGHYDKNERPVGHIIF